MDHFGFVLDVSRCTGCMACIVACLDQNDFKAEGQSFRKVTKYESDQFPSAKISYLSMACAHCGDAPCVAVCPTTAISKMIENGAVTVDRDLCIGCHTCAMACPFGAITFANDGKMAKCDLCMNRIEHGMDPACVRTCPTLALAAGPLKALSQNQAEAASIAILKSMVSTGE